MRERLRILVAAAMLLLAAVGGCGDDSDLAEATYISELGGVTAKLVVPINEPRSVGTYRLDIVSPDGNRVSIESERDGMVSDLWLADLGTDGVLEAVVAISSAGSGTYGTVDLYQARGGTFESLTLAPLDEDQRQGYMGHDVYSVEDGVLTRSFPRYAEGDSHAEPTGGTVSLVYSYDEGTWITADATRFTPE